MLKTNARHNLKCGKRFRRMGETAAAAFTCHARKWLAQKMQAPMMRRTDQHF
jgi:hypothetical protein